MSSQVGLPTKLGRKMLHFIYMNPVYLAQHVYKLVDDCGTLDKQSLWWTINAHTSKPGKLTFLSVTNLYMHHENNPRLVD